MKPRKRRALQECRLSAEGLHALPCSPPERFDAFPALPPRLVGNLASKVFVVEVLLVDWPPRAERLRQAAASANAANCL